MYWKDAVAGVSKFTLAGHTDWRLPTVKELYSLIRFNGRTGVTQEGSVPYIDTRYFDFSYGSAAAGDRFIDSQYCTTTKYVSTTMNGNPTFFGVNFADGRIKGYPIEIPGGQTKKYVIQHVRGKSGYGGNDFANNNNGTITDRASGLMWVKNDSGVLQAGDKKDGRLNWQQALAWCEGLNYAGYSDWRLPNAKELQGIVDYTRSPKTTASAAISPLFVTTAITDGNGFKNYPYFWTGTTHLDGPNAGDAAVYIAFGEAQGYMKTPTGGYVLMDVHGAGAQRSDPKAGNPADYPYGRGPQGDVISIYNFARCVRGNAATKSTASLKLLFDDIYAAALPGSQDRDAEILAAIDANGSTYYYQVFENSTALAAWTDGRVYYFDGTNVSYTGRDWQ
jgi:hypothetical protein